MIHKRQLLINALVGAAQVVVTGGAFFVLYRFLKDTIGMEEVGVWSVVLAWTSVSHVASLGMTGSATKFVSMYLARADVPHASRVIQTLLVSVAVLLGGVLVAVYPLMGWLVDVVIAPGKAAAAHAVVPYALASFWVTSLASMLGACIDGFQRVDLRHLLVMGAMLVYLLLAFWLVPEQGLVGLARAQVLQAGGLLLASWLLLRRLMPDLPLVPRQWRRAVFKEVLNYSLNLQLIGIAQMLFEPTAKSLVARLGGLEAAGFFELANKMVVQLRALIITAHQAVVPTIADLQERDPGLLRTVYVQSFRLVLFLVLPSLPLMIALTPLVGRLWLGAHESLFVQYADLLFAGWFLNVLSGPAYFANMGTGHLRWNVWGHLVTGVLNAGLGLRFGGAGVVAGFVVALVAGSAAVAVAYQREHGISMHEVVGRRSLLLGAAGIAGLAATLLAYEALAARFPPLLLGLLLAALYTACIAAPLWVHPTRRQVQAWVSGLLLRKSM